MITMDEWAALCGADPAAEELKQRSDRRRRRKEFEGFDRVCAAKGLTPAEFRALPNFDAARVVCEVLGLPGVDLAKMNEARSVYDPKPPPVTAGESDRT